MSPDKEEVLELQSEMTAYETAYLGAIICEYLMLHFTSFCIETKVSGASELRVALDEIWSTLDSAKELKTLPIDAEKIFSLAPDTEDHASRFTSRALDTCVVMGALIEFMQGKSDGFFDLMVNTMRDCGSERDVYTHVVGNIVGKVPYDRVCEKTFVLLLVALAMLSSASGQYRKASLMKLRAIIQAGW